MGLFARLFGGKRGPRAESQSFAGMGDPALLEYIRSGASSRAGLEVSAVYRSLQILSATVGMVPMRLMHRDAAGLYTREATDHALWPLLIETPNATQSAYTFKKLLTLRMLTHGNGYARIVRSGQRSSLSSVSTEAKRISL